MGKPYDFACDGLNFTSPFPGSHSASFYPSGLLWRRGGGQAFQLLATLSLLGLPVIVLEIDMMMTDMMMTDMMMTDMMMTDMIALQLLQILEQLITCPMDFGMNLLLENQEI